MGRGAVDRLTRRIVEQEKKFGRVPSAEAARKKAQKIADKADARKGVK